MRTAIPMSPAELAPYSGKFSAKNRIEFKIRLETNHLEIKTDLPFTPLLASAPNVFVPSEILLPIEVRFDSHDTGTLIIDGRPFPFIRVKDGKDKR